jgi:hypothetical protein
MHTHNSLAQRKLTWIKDAKLFLENHCDPILSDADTCDYFRKKAKAPVAKLSIPGKSENEPRPEGRGMIWEEFRTPPKSGCEISGPENLSFWRPDETAARTVNQDASDLPQKVPDIVISANAKEAIAELFPLEIMPQRLKPAEEVVQMRSKPASFLRALFLKIAPEMAILSELPNDAIAKKIANRWKTKNQIAPITVIYYQEQPEQKELLEKIAKALDVYFGPATLLFAEPIEREKEWKMFLSAVELKLIIICDYTLWQLQNLCQFYKETPTQKKRQLGEKPLFMLPDLSLYLKDPLLKRSLWKALCQTNSSLPSPSIKN